MSGRPDAGAEPYADQYAEGRRAGVAGLERDTNPYFSRADDPAGLPDSHEVWRGKYDVWRQGWMEGRSTFERGRTPPKVAAEPATADGKSQR